MRLSNKTEYGIRALVHLAENANGQPYCLQDISNKENISYSFLEKIFGELKKNGILISHRGIKGGYTLAKDINEISLKDIIEILEGKIIPFDSLVRQEKSPKLHCKSHLMLSIVQSKIVDSFGNIQLKDLINI